MDQHSTVMEFITHCCQSSHYTFDILKCGKDDCTICKLIRLPLNIFQNLHHIPHPVPQEDGHYFPFSHVFGSSTSEEHRPSFSKADSGKKKRVKRKLPYYASVQHIKNTQLMVQCTECNLWRLIFSKYKLTKEQRIYLQDLSDDGLYTCGATLKDLNLPEEFQFVDVHDCYDPIEKLYYSAKFDPICIYCAADQPFTSDDQYPQCSNCKDKEPIRKK